MTLPDALLYTKHPPFSCIFILSDGKLARDELHAWRRRRYLCSNFAGISSCPAFSVSDTSIIIHRIDGHDLQRV